MTPLKWFSGFLKKYRLVIVIGLVLMTVIVACAIVNPYISGMIVDDVIQGGAYDLLPKLIGITGVWLSIVLAVFLALFVTIGFLIAKRKKYYYA